MSNNQPIKQFRAGNCKAVVWENQGKNGSFFSVQFLRFYKDAEDKWQETNSFSGDEILRVQYLALQAYGWCEKQRQSSES